MKGPSTGRAARHLRTMCAIGALAPLPVLAQPAPETASAQLDTIVVTGTHAKDRTELNSTAPVDIISADDLRAAAGPEASVGQALAALLPSVNFLDQSNSGSSDHVRALQLRGLGPDQILVLINGKRVHTTSIVNVESTVGLGSVAVDFNSIPVNAIKRIEVLRDGAGAQYGSDAIAGVVNIILDDARTGGELAINAGEFVTDFAPTNRSIKDGQTVNAQGKYGVALGEGGLLRFGVDATSHQPTNRAGFDQFTPYAPFTNTQNPASTTITFVAGDAQVRNLNLWLNSAVPLAGGATAYAVALYNHRTSIGDAYFREPLDTGNNVPAIYPGGFLPESTGTNTDLHLDGGARGHLAAGWDYDASLTYGLNTFDYGLDHSLNASYGAASPTTFKLGGFRFGQATANLDITGDVNGLGLATPATFAFGAELRRENFSTSAGDPASYLDANALANPPVTPNPNGIGGSQGDGGLRPDEVADASRNIGGIYADLSDNLLPNVFADAAVRFDHYSDAGSATTGKLSGRWEFVQHWALRGAVSSNFRAPALAQIHSAYSPTAYGLGGGLATVNIVPVSDPHAIALGAQPLKPEKSRNYSVGLTAQPIAPVQLAVDLFRINIDDRIALSQAIQSASGAYYQFFTNAADTSTHGVDVVGSWTARVLGGSLRLSDASTWLSNEIRDIHAQPLDSSGNGLLFGLQAQNAITSAVPKHRDVLTATWSGDGAANAWNLLARVTHTGEVARVFDFGGGYVPIQNYTGTEQLDVEAEYRATRALSLALGALNLTDRYPTQSDPDINYGGNLPYDFLAPIGFNGRYVYLRLRYELR